MTHLRFYWALKLPCWKDGRISMMNINGQCWHIYEQRNGKLVCGNCGFTKKVNGGN
jgi:hypothetical protein